jgi:hypothetical protein
VTVVLLLVVDAPQQESARATAGLTFGVGSVSGTF